MSVDVRLNTDVQLDDIINKLDLLGSGVLPNTARAVKISASLVQRTWVNFAQGNDDSGKPSSLNFSGNIDYANSIQINYISPLHASIFSDSEIGKSLEKGTEDYDMKPALVGGPKSRVSKDGTRYNIIPFRHKTKGLKNTAMKSGGNAYTMAKSLVQQSIVGTKVDSEGKKRLAYAKWSKDKSLSGKGIPKKLQGLTRMKTGVGENKSSQYLTFRIVTLEQSGKWIKKGQPSWDIIGQVIKKTEANIKKIISDGIAKDLGM